MKNNPDTMKEFDEKFEHSETCSVQRYKDIDEQPLKLSVDCYCELKEIKQFISKNFIDKKVVEEEMEKAKQWIGDLLYENGVHQRDKHIFDKAENALEVFLAISYNKGKEDERERIINIAVERAEQWKEHGFEIDTLIDGLKIIKLEEDKDLQV